MVKWKMREAFTLQWLCSWIQKTFLLPYKASLEVLIVRCVLSGVSYIHIGFSSLRICTHECRSRDAGPHWNYCSTKKRSGKTPDEWIKASVCLICGGSILVAIYDFSINTLLLVTAAKKISACVLTSIIARLWQWCQSFAIVSWKKNATLPSVVVSDSFAAKQNPEGTRISPQISILHRRGFSTSLVWDDFNNVRMVMKNRC